jgi:hypothetical protein
MSLHRDAILEAAASITAAAYELSERNADVSDALLDAVHKIRGNLLMGALPDKSVMMGLARLLKDLSIPYAVIGGMAVAIHGIERETSDIDVLVESLPDAAKTMDSDYMNKFGFYRGKSRTGGHLVLDHKVGQCEFLPAKSAWQEWAIQTAQPQMVLGVTVPVLTAEALVVSKLKALTENPTRTKDPTDILGVLSANKGRLVTHSIEKWLTEPELARFKGLLAIA